jgi:hypothetical protein
MFAPSGQFLRSTQTSHLEMFKANANLTDVVNPIAGMVLDLEPLTLLHIAGLDELGPQGRPVGAFMSDFGRDPRLDGCVNRC